VRTDQLTFVHDRSEAALPRLDPTPLDLVLIDGGHGFPTPFVDWQYAGLRLREGGVLIVDDTHLWTGAVLRDFLDAQPGWEPLERLPMRVAAFRRTSVATTHEDFVDQPYVLRRSYHSGPRGALRRAVRGADVLRREGMSGVSRARAALSQPLACRTSSAAGAGEAAQRRARRDQRGADAADDAHREPGERQGAAGQSAGRACLPRARRPA
jgi:hypothetical protein